MPSRVKTIGTKPHLQKKKILEEVSTDNPADRYFPNLCTVITIKSTAKHYMIHQTSITTDE